MYSIIHYLFIYDVAVPALEIQIVNRYRLKCGDIDFHKKTMQIHIIYTFLDSATGLHPSTLRFESDIFNYDIPKPGICWQVLHIINRLNWKSYMWIPCRWD